MSGDKVRDLGEDYTSELFSFCVIYYISIHYYVLLNYMKIYKFIYNICIIGKAYSSIRIFHVYIYSNEIRHIDSRMSFAIAVHERLELGKIKVLI